MDEKEVSMVKQVLAWHADSQINLASESARTNLAEDIVRALKGVRETRAREKIRDDWIRLLERKRRL